MRSLGANVLEKIKEMLHQGKPTRKISRELKISQSSVVNARNEEDLSRVRVKSGRPKIMSERDARKIAPAIATGKARTSRVAAKMNGVQGSVWTQGDEPKHTSNTMRQATDSEVSCSHWFKDRRTTGGALCEPPHPLSLRCIDTPENENQMT